VCVTDLPDTFKGLAKQRRRWDTSGTVRMQLRKHIDLANPFHQSFRMTNFLIFVEALVTDVLCPLAIIGYVFMHLDAYGEHPLFTALTMYLCYVALEAMTTITNLYYARNLRQALGLCAVFPLVPLYQVMMLSLRALSALEEALFRVSFSDSHVPDHVRRATWRW
jgi:poly-beta-1,6-N-acetyl-D-glucosamine synthase